MNLKRALNVYYPAGLAITLLFACSKQLPGELGRKPPESSNPAHTTVSPVPTTQPTSLQNAKFCVWIEHTYECCKTIDPKYFPAIALMDCDSKNVQRILNPTNIIQAED